MLQVGHVRDTFVVAVVVDERDAGRLRCGAEQQVGGRDAAMAAIGGQKQLDLACAAPEIAWHRNRFEDVKAPSDSARTVLIRSKAGQLKYHQIADKHPPRLDLGVEPICKVRKAAIPRPRPDAGVEERRAVERDRPRHLGAAQSRSRPSRTSSGVPSTSRRTSKPRSTRRRVASRRAALTVSLRPFVPNSRRAASSARSSTSTVVRVMRIIVPHHQFPMPGPTCFVYNNLGMETLPRIRIAGDRAGVYVVLGEQPNGQLKIAPERTAGLPRVVTLEWTTWACPTQWVATLADGRTVYARSRHGELSVGVGNDLDDAVLKSCEPEALYFEYVEDSPLGFDELRAHLYGLLEFPADLPVEGAEIESLD